MKIAKLFKIITYLILVALLLIAALFAYLSVTEYKPNDTEEIEIVSSEPASPAIHAGDSLSLLSWNIGYGALGDNADFFMDGGSSVYTADKERVESNLSGISKALDAQDPYIILMQEVDEDSSRSRHINQVDYFRDKYPDYASSFAYNYKAAFVPFPVPPLGKVASGIMTFSKYPVESSIRYQLPIPFSWPVRMANLKRALLVSRIKVEGSSNELVIVNLHLEAYDSGEGKIAQTKMLAEILSEEQKKGNYVIAGGDFNQIFSSKRGNMFPVLEDMWAPGIIDDTEITGDWQFLMDEAVPSCRSLDQPYAGADKEIFQYYLIDGFIVSENISVEEFKNLDLGFICSDHNPVLLKIALH